MSELRFYTFVNFYLREIQQGIQSFHVLGEMVNKYPYDEDVEPSELPEGQRLHDWNKNHKTLIILNGGANTDIEDKYFQLERLSKNLSFPMPFEKFREDEKSLGGIMTACGCVLPEEIYGAVDYKTAVKLEQTWFVPGQSWFNDATADTAAFYFIKDNEVQVSYKEGTPEHELITLIKSCPLAR